ncbi:hypothetical protein QJS66_09510 [Kocuria rhizophila]|nr:hypothetical protein QJS66_09510 [Kocuria rhizophila]
MLDLDVLTIGFARRVPTYKRLTSAAGPERLKRIRLHSQRPAQLAGGRQVPPRGRDGQADDPGPRALHGRSQGAPHQSAFRPTTTCDGPALPGRDAWASPHNPPRPLEACGTSGMKAAINGGLNLSALDGWWDDVRTDSNGWPSPPHGKASTDERDDVEAAALYELIESHVAPRLTARRPGPTHTPEANTAQSPSTRAPARAARHGAAHAGDPRSRRSQRNAHPTTRRALRPGQRVRAPGGRGRRRRRTRHGPLGSNGCGRRGPGPAWSTWTRRVCTRSRRSGRARHQRVRGPRPEPPRTSPSRLEDGRVSETHHLHERSYAAPARSSTSGGPRAVQPPRITIDRSWPLATRCGCCPDTTSWPIRPELALGEQRRGRAPAAPEAPPAPEHRLGGEGALLRTRAPPRQVTANMATLCARHPPPRPGAPSGCP